MAVEGVGNDTATSRAASNSARPGLRTAELLTSPQRSLHLKAARRALATLDGKGVQDASLALLHRRTEALGGCYPQSRAVLRREIEHRARQIDRERQRRRRQRERELAKESPATPLPEPVQEPQETVIPASWQLQRWSDDER